MSNTISNPLRPTASWPGKRVFRGRRPDETETEYAKRMAAARAEMADRMNRTRNPHLYD